MKNYHSKELIQLQSSEISKIREEILQKQGWCCALCSCKITEKTGISLDHQHKFSYEENGEDGAGLIRGVLCRSCNVLEGKIWNNTNRYLGKVSVNDRIKWLESLILYYQNENYDIIHPSEKPKEQKISKRNYNKLKKVYNMKAKFPDYPKTGKITIKLKQLFEKYNINPYN